MPFPVQTTQQISDTIIAQLEANLSQTIPLLPRSFTRVLAKALSGVFVLLWRYAGFMFLQMFVRYATDTPTQVGTRIIRPLTEWGRISGVGERGNGQRAELTIEITVINQTGTVAAGKQLLRADTGLIYVLLEDVSLDAATKQASVRAVSDQDGNSGVGSAGNLETGDVVSFLSPISNISRDATVVSVDVNGADAEEVEVYRGRIIRRFQSPPQGGAYADYEAWGKEPAGILNVYPYTASDPGEMDIYVEATVESSGSADGIPTAAQLQAVEDAITYTTAGLAARRPAGIEALNVAAITRTAFDVTVSNLDPDTTEIRTGIEDALTEYFLDREPYILGLSPLPRKDRVSGADVSGIVSSVAAAHGSSVSGVDLEPDGGGTPITVQPLTPGEKAKLGSVDWV